METDKLEAMLTARQVADFLQVSISTVRRWSDNGLLQFYRIGSRGDRRYQRKDVLKFLHSSTMHRQSGSPPQQAPAFFRSNVSSVALEESRSGASRPNRQ